MAEFIQRGGTGGGSYAKYFSCKLSVWEISNDITSNTTNVGYRLELISGSSGRFTDYTANYSVNINGTQVKSGSGRYTSQSYNTTQTICEGTTTITHNADGTKTISCSASLDFQSGTYSPGNFNPSGTMTLSTIPRASSVGATSAYIEENTIININRASSSFRHTLECGFFGEITTIVTKTAETTVSWQLPSSYYEKIPNQKSSYATITCITYSGDKEIGRSKCTFTVNTNESKCKPDLTAELVDINEATIALTQDNKKLIKYKSTAKVTITTSAKNGASISSKKVNNSTVSGDSISINSINTDTFTVTVTDSRGYTNTKVVKPTEIINYVPLTINANVFRPQPTTGEVSTTFSGNYFNGSFGTTNNSLTITWYYREKGTSAWKTGGTLGRTIKNNTYNNGTTAIVLGSTFDYQKAYEFYLKVADKLTTLSPTFSITEGIPIVNWGKDFFNINGTLMLWEKAFNTYSTSEDVEIGEWIDGKKLYRKVIVINSPKMDGSWVNYAHNIKDADTIFPEIAFLHRSSDNAFIPIPDSSPANTVTKFDITNEYISYFGDEYSSIDKMIVVCNFTKK